MQNKPSVCSRCGASFSTELCPVCTLEALRAGGVVPSMVNRGPEIAGLMVHEEVGEGGFGVVYRATQIDAIHRAVALKILKPGVDTRQVLRRFEVERQTLAHLEHPGIARFYQAGETSDGYPWFTMEFIKGESISDSLAGKDLSQILEAFLRVCEAVSFAHEKGVIHRDLKPSNILVTADGVPKVIDFGVAKATGHVPGTTLYTADELIAGTPAYMAPERGDEIDARVDVYALGAILYELLTGAKPPEDDRLRAPSAMALRKVPKALDRIVLHAVATDREQRYSSVHDLAVDIRRFLNGDPVKGLSRKFHPGWLGVFAIPLVALLVMSPAKNPVKPPAMSPIRLEAFGDPYRIWINVDGSRALAIFRANGCGVLFDPRNGEEIKLVSGKRFGMGSGGFSEDGKRFLVGESNGSFRWFASEDGRALTPQIDCTPLQDCWVVDLKHLDERVIAATSDGFVREWTEGGAMKWQKKLISPPYGLEISGDHRTMLSGSASGTINLIDLTTQELKHLKGHKAHIYGLAFSPDGQYFASASYDGRAGLWKRDGTSPVTMHHDGKCCAVAFAPDGKTFASASFDGTARVWSVETGEELAKLTHDSDVLTVSYSPDGKFLASGGRDHQLRVWSLGTRSEAMKSFDCGGDIADVEFAIREDGGWNLLAITWDGGVWTVPLELSR